MWKLLSSILSDEVYAHLHKENILPFEQKGCFKGSKGSKDHLLVDKMILQEARHHHNNLELAWVDYRKAYDSVSHSWLLECLQMFKLHSSLQLFLSLSMKQWRTELTFAGDSLGVVNIRRGIFQGDSFSPLLFIMSLIPLSFLLHDTSMGYKLWSGRIVNHLLYMDDLKLYGRSNSEITSLVRSVELFSSDIGMSFCVAKCAHLGLKRGKIYSTEGIYLPDGMLLRSLTFGETYKYLGVLQSSDVEHGSVRQCIEKEYKRRLKLILSSKLTSNNMFKEINSYTVPVLRYSAGIVKWPIQVLQQLDRQTRKLLTVFRGRHRRSDVDRLYIPRKQGGRGLFSAEDVVHAEECSLFTYVNKGKDPLIQEISCTGIFQESERKDEFLSRRLN